MKCNTSRRNMILSCDPVTGKSWKKQNQAPENKNRQGTVNEPISDLISRSWAGGVTAFDRLWV